METAFGNYIQEAESEEGAPSDTGTGAMGLAPHIERRVRDHIEANFHAELRHDALAEIAGMSRFHFAAMFRISFGESTHRYIVQRRVAKASHLLRETNPLSSTLAKK